MFMICSAAVKKTSEYGATECLLPLRPPLKCTVPRQRQLARVVFSLEAIGFSSAPLHPRAFSGHLLAMTSQEKKRLSSFLRITEYLFQENIALKLVLDHRQVPRWRKLVDRLLDDKEMMAGVHLKFRDIYKEIEGSSDPTSALESFLEELPARKKPQ